MLNKFGAYDLCLVSFLQLQLTYTAPESRVHIISSPFHDNRNPLIFQWAFTLRISSVSHVEKLMASGCHETETIFIMNTPEEFFNVHFQ